MRKLLLLLAAFIALPVVMSAQARSMYHTALFDTLNPGVVGSSWNYSALTGYAAPDGREYALLGSYNGTHIIDVTDKPIVEVAFIPGPHNAWREMKAVGGYAYVVTEGGGGLQIIDLTGLPETATLKFVDTSVFRSGHTIDLEGNYIYVNGSNAEAGANRGTLIFDISKNPARPTFVGKWSGRYVHDAAIRNDTLYAAAINDGALDIVYLGKDRKSPTKVGQIAYPGAGTHNADLTADGSYIMTTDEINTTPKTLKIWDRRDIENISQVADFTPAPGEVIHNVHTKGKLAVIAWYTAGTRIIDISDPRDPVEIGYFDEYYGPNGGYNGNWEVYPYLPSGKMIASDMRNGLYVFTFDGAKKGSVYGVVRDEATGNPIPYATIQLPELRRTVTADGQGGYTISSAVGTLGFAASSSNRFATGSLILTESGHAFDIFLAPMADVQIRVIDEISGSLIDNFSYWMGTSPAKEGTATSNPQEFFLPKGDSIRVAAWGYLPQTVEVTGSGNNTMELKLKHGYYDDAEMDLGWSLSLPGDDAPRGQWERDIPVGTDAGGLISQPGIDATPAPGDHAFITGIINSDGGAGANDIDSGHVTLTSPRFNLSTYKDPYLNFALWYNNTNGDPSTVDDTLYVLVSNNNGASWRTLLEIDAALGGWTRYHLPLSKSLAPTSQMLFRVVASDLHGQSLVEAGLDDFSVSEEGTTSAGIGNESAVGTGVEVVLHPNPFTSAATVSIMLERSQQHARLELFDMLGRSIAILHTGAMNDGINLVKIDGSSLATGRYTWQLMLDSGRTTGGSVVVVR